MSGENSKHKRVKRDRIEFDGIVLEAFRSARFSVKLKTDTGDGTIVTCTLCGKMKQNFIKIVPGDPVRVELCAYDMTNGRIISRGGRENRSSSSTTSTPS